MKEYWLALLFAQASWLGSLPAASAQDGTPGAGVPHPDGYLLVPDRRPGVGRNLVAQPYQPQAGDVLFYTQTKYEKLFRLVGSGSPTHVGIVFARPDGTPATLELTGPQVMFATVHHLDVGPRLVDYPGEIMVRQPRAPLTQEQSAALTHFAQAREGDGFARGRLFLQGTPFRCRNGLRLQLFGHTYFERNRWLCSELVMAAAATAGMVDPKAYPANAMYPRDLAFDERYDLSHVFGPPFAWTAHPLSTNKLIPVRGVE